GRWSLVNRAPSGDRHAPDEEDALAEVIARQWLDRYGVVARDWWRRERPPIAWRSIYRQLRRMELRGEVRRGYFVRGLAGAQFAPPAAVEELRGAAEQGSPEPVVLLASDPANVWNLPLSAIATEAVDIFARPRGARAVLVMQDGRVILTSDHA